MPGLALPKPARSLGKVPSLAWVPEPRSFLPFSFKTALPTANQSPEVGGETSPTLGELPPGSKFPTFYQSGDFQLSYRGGGKEGKSGN